ncbi:MAG: hypothetical protein OEY23_24545 [Acidimicrobiia bacterium]|nr:hypothetical protein [Acidimicrobiia bacterium]
MATAPEGPHSELTVNVVRRSDAHERLMLLVHGYGADEHDLASLVEHVDPDGRFLVVCPRGPFDVFPGAGWYQPTALTGVKDDAGLVRSFRALDALLTSSCEAEGLARAESVVAGFSQGAAMSLAVAYAGTRPRPAAVVAMSGYLPTADGLDFAWDDGALPPALVQHGTYDPLLPVELGEDAARTLTGHGVTARYEAYPMAHEVSLASVESICEWLRATLG